MSLQRLSPSLQGKQRYIVFRIVGKELSFDRVVSSVWESLLDVLGAKGVARADPWLLKNLYVESEGRGVLRVSRACVEDARLSLALMERIGGSRICCLVEGVTGTIDAAEERYL